MADGYRDGTGPPEKHGAHYRAARKRRRDQPFKACGSRQPR